MSKILITGATGHLGSEVIKLLIEKVGVENLAVLVRNPEKGAELAGKGVQVIQGNYEDYDSLVKAFQGVDKLYFVSSSEIVNRAAQHENVVKAAVEAQVGHLIYTSFQRKTEGDASPIALVAAGHLAAEAAILASGLTYTLLKHGLYTEIIPMFIGDVLQTGTIFLPTGEGKVAFATRSDMAQAAIPVLTEPGYENKTYDFGGPESVSFADVAAILSELSGKTIQYVSPSPEAFHQALAGAGVPEEAIQGVSSFSAAIAQGEFDFPVTTLVPLLGHEPTSVKTFLKGVYGL